MALLAWERQAASEHQVALERQAASEHRVALVHQVASEHRAALGLQQDPVDLQGSDRNREHPLDLLDSARREPERQDSVRQGKPDRLVQVALQASRQARCRRLFLRTTALSCPRGLSQGQRLHHLRLG